jgi:hypothetical protein
MTPCWRKPVSNPRAAMGDGIFRAPLNPATRNRHGSQNRILTIDKGRFIVR